jgi:hypothetical protein
MDLFEDLLSYDFMDTFFVAHYATTKKAMRDRFSLKALCKKLYKQAAKGFYANVIVVRPDTMNRVAYPGLAKHGLQETKESYVAAIIRQNPGVDFMFVKLADNEAPLSTLDIYKYCKKSILKHLKSFCDSNKGFKGFKRRLFG